MDRLPLFVEPVPTDLAWDDPEENLRRVAAALDERIARRPDVLPEARLFVFPELTLTGFVTKSPRSFGLEPPDPAVAGLLALAAGRGVGLAAGFPERNPADPARPFNTLALVGPDGAVAASYRKVHLYTAGKNPETAVYSAGAAARVCRYRGWRVGFALCFDARFPALFRAYAGAGADLILLSSCWIGGPHKTLQYRTLAASHAISAQAYVAAVNRSGRDPFYEFDGTAAVFSPWGEDVLAGGPCRLDPAELEAYRRLIVRPWDQDRPDYPVV